MSLTKFQNGFPQPAADGRNLYFNRADLDGAPFRGGFAPLLKDDEYENLAHRVCDAHVEQFNLSNEEERSRYQQILDCAANQWFTILFIDRQYDKDAKSWVVLIEWAEWYMEISPANMRRAAFYEGRHGFGNLGNGS